jgi:chemotaxis protein CheX
MHSPALIELPDVLDIKAAAPLAGELLAMRGKAVEIDASRVKRVGGQCLQVLLSAAMTWKADGVALAIVNASGDFVDGLARLGASVAGLSSQEGPQ